MSETIHVDWEKMRAQAGPYPRQAFQFVRDGLAHAVERTHGEGLSGDSSDESKHVSGQELCLGLREYALDRYGCMAGTVLDHWGLHATDDFGRIVFAMVEAGLMNKTEDDRLEDFHCVYTFAEAFSPKQLSS